MIPRYRIILVVLTSMILAFVPAAATADHVTSASDATEPAYAPGVTDSPYARFIASARQCPDSSTRNASNLEQARAMRCLVNYARAEKGLSQLRSHHKLNSAARIKSARIVRCQDFSHTACGRSLRSIFEKVGYLPSNTGWGIGENLGWGSGSLGTPQARMRGWLESEGHRRNIFNSKWRDQGMGLEVATFKGREHAAVWSNEFGVINSSSSSPSSSATRSQLRYRERKHDFYHNDSQRPAAERRTLAIKWHELVAQAR